MWVENRDITFLKGVGEKRAKLYAKLGIATVSDLLTYYPRDYVDFSAPQPIAEAEVNEPSVFKAEVVSKASPYYGRVNVYKAVLSDGTDELLCVFFNVDYAFRRLEIGKEYLFYGRVEGNLLMKELHSPLFIEVGSKNLLTPKYHLTEGLSNGIISANLRAAMELMNGDDPLPKEIVCEYDLLSFREAIAKIHFPESVSEYMRARRRLAFQELLTLQLGLGVLKRRNRQTAGIVMDEQDISAFYRALPFTPTGAQLRAVSDCLSDMKRDTPMSRLLQGDVGSGKTLVAAAVCYYASLCGCQSVLMAPTELLAKQHYGTLSSFLAPLGVKLALLTGSLTPKEKREVKERIKSGEAQVVIGTQALIQKGVEFLRLGLVITDEQHRFGVNQRSLLASKGLNPHTLVMSATPIPRTLALIIYGDLDISVLDEMPKGRLPIKTYGVDTSYRPRLYKFILKYIAQGKQAYIVCPVIGENANEKAGAIEYFNTLKEGPFKDTPIGLLHGKMKQADKDAAMLAFKNNELKVLVSTTVIEVGVDVPNAVVMLIENAEQFGLSQLHQLRGRVGRGDVQSHCILVTDNKSDYTKSRVDAMVATSDGFEIANTDLKLRGPGDFFGNKQHGLPSLKIADMSEDTTLLSETRSLSETILERDATLDEPANACLKNLVNELFAHGADYGFN